MAFVLAVELLQTCVWIVGVNVAGAATGAAPWKRISTARADRLCYPVSLLNFWLDPMLFASQTVVAYFLWAWIVRNRSLDVLQRQVPWAFGAVALFSAGLKVSPPSTIAISVFGKAASALSNNRG